VSTSSPYTTLFRSREPSQRVGDAPRDQKTGDDRDQDGNDKQAEDQRQRLLGHRRRFDRVPFDVLPKNSAEPVGGALDGRDRDRVVGDISQGLTGTSGRDLGIERGPPGLQTRLQVVER